MTFRAGQLVILDEASLAGTLPLDRVTALAANVKPRVQRLVETRAKLDVSDAERAVEYDAAILAQKAKADASKADRALRTVATRAELEKSKSARSPAPDSSKIERKLVNSDNADQSYLAKSARRGVAGPFNPKSGRSLAVRASEWAAAQLLEFAGLTISGDTIIFRGEVQKLKGSHATVDAGGGIGRRTTATRVVAGGLIFGKTGAVVGAIAKKKVDDRELYILVDGEAYSWSVKVDPKKGAEARAFAARLNTAARR